MSMVDPGNCQAQITQSASSQLCKWTRVQLWIVSPSLCPAAHRTLGRATARFFSSLTNSMATSVTVGEEQALYPPLDKGDETLTVRLG